MGIDRRRGPPGPTDNWLLGVYPDFQRDWFGTLTKLARTYGDVVGYRMGPFRFVLLSHPDVIAEVLVSREKELEKSWHERMGEPILGKGIFLSEGALWKRQRRMMSPPFHRSAIASYAPQMERWARRETSRWADGEIRDLQQDLYRITLGIVAETLFGGEIGDDLDRLNAMLESARHAVGKRIASPVVLPDWVPTPAVLEMRRAKRQLDALIDRFIAVRRASGERHNDILSLLLAARDEDDGTGMSDAQIRDECTTLFIAGFETTATALAWAVYLLGRHPQEQARLAEEIDRVLAGRPPSGDDVAALRYTTWVVYESMRLFSPAWTVGRAAVRDMEIGGYFVRKGTTVAASQWIMHRHPRHWDRPDDFVPERWDNDLHKRVSKQVYFPFGFGPRVCIGGHFAMLEAILVLATIVQRFELSTVREATPSMKFVNRPDPGAFVRLRARRKQPPSPG